MAYKDSGDLPIGRGYWLGSYSFELRVAHIHEPGEEDVVSVYAICRHINPDMSQESRETQAVDFPAGTKIESWSVEANETEASVYVKTDFVKLDTGDVPVPVPTSSTMSDGPYIYGSDTRTLTATWTVNGGVGVGEIVSGTRKDHLMASGNAEATWSWIDSAGGQNSGSLSSSFTYQGKTVYYYMSVGTGFKSVSSVTPSATGDLAGHAGAVAWTMIYGDPANVPDETLVGRFAIDIREADGGPGGDWDEPGSDGPPDKTLYVTVTGATGGSIQTPPPDRAQAEIYGMGGSGGDGGGGGGGASTVIIYDFATSRAGKVEQEAIARSPGCGGPGGKGGKGGDGCILIFY